MKVISDYTLMRFSNSISKKWKLSNQGFSDNSTVTHSRMINIAHKHSSEGTNYVLPLFVSDCLVLKAFFSSRAKCGYTETLQHEIGCLECK